MRVLRASKDLAMKSLKLGPVDVAIAGVGLIGVLMDVFKSGKTNAKLAGKLLAHALAVGFPFPT